MSRIGASISGIEQYLLRHLSQVNSEAVNNSVRLATGKKVNFPSDGPAAFYLVSDFEQRLNVVNKTKTQVEIAAGIGAEAQNTLDLVHTNLDAIRELLVGVRDGTIEDTAHAQTQIDAMIEQINTLAQTEINGRRYLDGSVNYLVSGRNGAQVSGVDVRSARDTTITGSVTAATQASVTYKGKGGEEIKKDATFELTGERGTATFSVTKDEKLTDVRDRINDESHNTGITAEVSGKDLIFTSVDYGEDAIIDLDVTSGEFDTSGTTQGADAVVTINGVEISSNNVDKNWVTYNRNGLHFTLDLTAGYTGAIDTMTISDSPVAKFALTPDLHRVTRLALPGITSAHLGGESGRLFQLASGGSLAGMGSNTSQAIRVVDEALSDLSFVEARVDAFADVTVQSSADLLDSFSTTIEETLADINGVNEDEEKLLLAKNQALSANTVAAISILQEQQQSMIGLLRMMSEF